MLSGVVLSDEVLEGVGHGRCFVTKDIVDMQLVAKEIPLVDFSWGYTFKIQGLSHLVLTICNEKFETVWAVEFWAWEVSTLLTGLRTSFSLRWKG